jgi:hypothetical protein
MAVRDRNLFAWQAYVITMAFVSVGLLLGMFFLWRSYADLSKTSETDRTQLRDARGELTKSNDRVRRLKSMLGYGSYTDEELKAMADAMQADAEIGEVEKDFAEQMKLFAKNDKESDKNLLKLPKYLMDTIRLRNQEIDRARKREQQIQKEQTDILQRETAARDDAQNKMREATQLLEAERATHSRLVASLNAEKEEIAKQFSAHKAVFDKQLQSQAAEIAALKTKTKQQADTIAEQLSVIKQFREDDFAAPQGKIIRVSDGGQVVWIDLGSEDGLREGVPFSVLDSTTAKVSKATPKARLQITRVIDAHLSQAKVTEYSIHKTILTGDLVYSPAWRPGRTVGFALVGSMDVNGDFTDDSEMVKELIRMAGGRVDAVLDSKLVSEGKLGVGTQFLVIGADVSQAGETADQKERREKYAAFINEAKGFGATQMSLDNLMGYLKPRNSERTVPLGNRIRASDFQIQPLENPPSNPPPDSFRPRNPD